MRKLLLAALVASAIGFSSGSYAQTTTCQVSLAQYNQLRNGMTYAEAVRILGCAGSEMSSSEVSGFVTVMYMWTGRGGIGANMNAMFQNGAMMMKAQFGLR